jgi:hypothetical protein
LATYHVRFSLQCKKYCDVFHLRKLSLLLEALNFPSWQFEPQQVALGWTAQWQIESHKQPIMKVGAGQERALCPPRPSALGIFHPGARMIPMLIQTVITLARRDSEGLTA